jgi:DNA-binding transcriptional MerR regulator
MEVKKMLIAEVSAQYSLSVDTLRYYERIGLIPPVTRNRNGIRNFTEMDCIWVGFIKCMRSAGIPVETLIEYVALFQKGDATRQVRKEMLIEQRALLAQRITEMQEALEKLDFKIANYDTLLLEYEKKMT